LEKLNDIFSIKEVQNNGFSKIIRYASKNPICITKNNQLASMVISFEAYGLDNTADMFLDIYNNERGMFETDIYGNSMVINREALMWMLMSVKKYFENVAYKRLEEKLSGKT